MWGLMKEVTLTLPPKLSMQNLYIEYLYKDLKKASGDKDQVKLVLYWYRIMITAADPYSAGY